MILRTSLFVSFSLFLFVANSFAQVAESEPTRTAQDQAVVTEIERILSVQGDCWNEGNIEGFMETYWKSEELTFSSGGTTTRGWQATLDGYKKRYPAGNMGALTFDHLETTLLGEGNALVLGQWHLKYKNDDRKDGNFSLVLRRIDGAWKIVHDHSSIVEPEENKVEI